ncbi:MAG: DUF4982 domain-containing protein [Marinilabiliaceae bacterium]|nr:DUF4982 domain-containing protein [Marinilabiliaceae bacterium]
MRKILFVIPFLFGLIGVYINAQIPTNNNERVRQVINFDKSWRFVKDDVKGAEQLKFNDKKWHLLDLPHDWSIEGEFDRDEPSGRGGGYLPTGIGWYRKQLDVPKTLSGKRFYIEFDGVMSFSEVFVNGVKVGYRPYGYSGFQYDITEQVKPGKKNIVAVRVDNSKQPASRWYTGSGIYRHVRFIVKDLVNISHWGVFITTPKVSNDNATVEIETEIKNSSTIDQEIKLVTELFDPSNKSVGSVEKSQKIVKGQSLKLLQTVNVENPILWDLDNPVIYEAVSKVYVNNVLIDDKVSTFGIRSMKFDAATGFYLNEKNIKIQGVCLHHDGGAFGAAVPLSVWRNRLTNLKEIGVNAIRTAHNPFAPEFYDLCDRMGFLVMDETFDTWTAVKNHARYGYHTIFNDWWEADTRDMILRDRNHPSIFIYSLGNEIRDRIADKEGQDRFIKMRDLAHQLDPSRPNTVALFRPNSDWAKAYTNGFAELMDVVGQNYRENELVQAHKDKPDRIVIGTENGHTRQAMVTLRDEPFMSGQFIWTGYDYLGEADWPEIDHGFGIFDRLGNYRAATYQRESWWGKKPVAYIVRKETNAGGGNWVADWTPKDYDTYDVAHMEVYSNCDSVEVFINGKSLGVKDVPNNGSSVSYISSYEKGILKVVGFIDGKELASQEFHSATYPEKIVLSLDQNQLAFNSDEVMTVTVKVVDENGVENPLSDALIYFEVEGPGKIVGVDNGDLECHTSMKGSSKRLYRGTCNAYIQATQPLGVIKVKARGKFLPESSVEFKIEGDKFILTK